MFLPIQTIIYNEIFKTINFYISKIKQSLKAKIKLNFCIAQYYEKNH